MEAFEVNGTHVCIDLVDDVRWEDVRWVKVLLSWECLFGGVGFRREESQGCVGRLVLEEGWWIWVVGGLS